MALKSYPFCEELLELVQDFHCGDRPWHTELSEWIKSRGSGNALWCLGKGKCEVWLYADAADEIVAFSSLGKTKWPWPEGDEKQLSVIPYVAVSSACQRRGYCSQVLNHLYLVANQKDDREPLIGLFVHPENTDAKAFYLQRGFRDFSHTHCDRETQVVYQAMIRSLPVVA